MKKDNKKLQYTLIVLLVAIWGTVAYRMMTWNSSDSDFNMGTQETLPIAQEAEMQKDSFVLKTNYKDPFLEKRVASSSSKISTSSSSKKSSKYKRKAPPSIPGRNTQKMPAIQYLGYSINETMITRVRLAINKKPHTLKLNQTLKGVTIKEMYKDSVVVAWKGQQKTYFRKKR